MSSIDERTQRALERAMYALQDAVRHLDDAGADNLRERAHNIYHAVDCFLARVNEADPQAGAGEKP
jgi:hypothetical protein